MAHLFNPLHLRPSNGLSQTHIRARTNPKAPYQELRLIPYRMLSVSCLVQRIPPIRRVNTLFLGVSIATPSIQRRSRLFQVLVVFQFPSLCPIMALLIMGLRIMDLPTSHTMLFLRLNNNTAMEWATIWLVRAQTTHCHPIMHLPIWPIDQ